MSTSAPLLAVFDHLLHQEVDTYEALLRLHQDAQRHLAVPALEPLLTNLQSREHLARHLTKLEQQRTDVLAQLLVWFPSLPQPVTLANLSAQVDEPYQSQFLRYRRQLRQLVDAIQELNRRQTPLLMEARAFVDQALAFLARWLPTQPTYQASGYLSTPTQGRLLSGKV